MKIKHFLVVFMLAILCPIYHCVNSIKKLLIIVRAGNMSWTALVVLRLILSLLTMAVAFQFNLPFTVYPERHKE